MVLLNGLPDCTVVLSPTVFTLSVAIHVKVDAISLVNGTLTVPPLHIVALLPLVIVGGGLTFTVSANVVEGQPLAIAVIVKMVDCKILVELVNVPVILAPLPFAAIPVRITVLSLTQLKVVPAIPFVLVIVIVVIGTPEQTA